MVKIEAITGKYMYLTVQGVEYRVYFEENGKGIPLVCQHTAGCDGRQWRHLFNDKDITSKYRVIAFDLPYHGKSLPPESVEWWTQEYKLTKKFMLDFHTEFCRALELVGPVYIGCSMGGSLAPDLALERPDLYKAVIGIESGMGVGQAMSAAMQPMLHMLNHPRISNEFKAASMTSLMAPTSPEKYRRETIWVYSSNAPSVFEGDLYYYITDHDMNDGSAKKIDTSRVGVYMLTGEYDASNTTEDSRKLAEHIKGAKYSPMKELGHFGMTENFQLLKKHLMPMLDEIASKRK